MGQRTSIPYAERGGGYTAAASWLARDPDNEPFIFRKFDRLAAFNLLCLQSEILELEQKLDAIHASTLSSEDMELKDAASTWETLIVQCESANVPSFAAERMGLIEDLRKKLKHYRESSGVFESWLWADD